MCVLAAATAIGKTSYVPDGPAQISHHKSRSVSISSSAQTSGLQPVNCVKNIGLNALETMVGALG